MDYTVINHLTYLALSIALTVWVAHTLHANGRVFLVEAFGREDIADSINHLLIVGFYLINLGFILLGVRFWGHAENWTGLIESVATKVGVVMLILGAIHFINLKSFWALRRDPDARDKPAVPPDYRYTAPPATQP